MLQRSWHCRAAVGFRLAFHISANGHTTLSCKFTARKHLLRPARASAASYVTNEQMSRHLSELPTDESLAPKTHLVLLVSGLAGSPDNWEVMMESLNLHADTTKVALLASGANTRTQTLHGIDTCGQRLAQEVQEYILCHPSLERLSIIAHSMGGLVCRYFIGRMYDPATKRIAGLQPAHFFAMATPHAGCSGYGITQVPFFSLFDYVPLLGPLIRRAVAAMAPTLSAVFMRRTGAQFFLHDREGGRPPLVVRLSKDVKGEGLFITALGSFITRTAYANSSGDHLIGWPNSSLRRIQELPRLPPGGTGVVRADPVESAYWPDYRPQGAELSWRDQLQEAESQELTETTQLTSSSQRDRPSTGDSATTLEIISRLQALPWRRVDVSFKGAKSWASTHNLIQVTKRRWHYAGVGVGRHLARQFAKMEAFEAQSR